MPKKEIESTLIYIDEDTVLEYSPLAPEAKVWKKDAVDSEIIEVDDRINKLPKKDMSDKEKIKWADEHIPMSHDVMQKGDLEKRAKKLDRVRRKWQ